MHQISADGVSPVHRSPLPTEGIVLVKQMKLALKLNQAMGIIHPTHRRLKMVVFSPWMLCKCCFVLGDMLFYPVNFFLVPLRIETQNMTH